MKVLSLQKENSEGVALPEGVAALFEQMGYHLICSLPRNENRLGITVPWSTLIVWNAEHGVTTPTHGYKDSFYGASHVSMEQVIFSIFFHVYPAATKAPQISNQFSRNSLNIQFCLNTQVFCDL